jgi:hypothetical protein
MRENGRLGLRIPVAHAWLWCAAGNAYSSSALCWVRYGYIPAAHHLLYALRVSHAPIAVFLVVTYYWEHIKIMLMILLSHICQLSNLFAYQFLNKLTCAILMKLQIYFFRLVVFIMILVACLKASQLSTFPY